MSRNAYVQELNRNLRELGAKAQLLEEGQPQNAQEPGLVRQLNELLEQAQNTGTFLPFSQAGEILGLSDYEKILTCLLWYRHRALNKGIEYEKMVSLLAPYEDMAGPQMLSPCFWSEDGHVVLSPVFLSFLEAQPPKLFSGVGMTWPDKRAMYDRERLLVPGSRLLEKNGEWDENEPIALVLNGEKGSGRDFVAEQLAADLGLALLHISVRPEGYLKRQLNEMILSVSLYDALVYADVTEYVDEAFLKELSFLCPFLILKKNTTQIISGDIGYICCNQEIRNPNARVKQEILADATSGSGSDAGDREQEWPQLLLKELKRSAMLTRQIPMGVFLRTVSSIRTELQTGCYNPEKSVLLQENLQLQQLPASRTFDELKLPKPQYDQLLSICNIISARDHVMTKWGFGQKFSYGNGISVLFYGAPGTGKTMTAQVMANRLAMPLLRVDLSQLISKFIGETQKNIRRIFEEAERSECILLFDEADAVFTRRSEVTDAQDRYSNAETAYLLQRIEQYTGVSVLATNLMQNFDEAFRRRITYMVHFPMPDETLREALWETILPKEAPIAEELDYGALARTFELSGAAIKNAAMHGACHAMSRGASIEMQDLLDGIQIEYTKQGKSLSVGQKEFLERYQK